MLDIASASIIQWKLYFIQGAKEELHWELPRPHVQWWLPRIGLVTWSRVAIVHHAWKHQPLDVQLLAPRKLVGKLTT